MLKKSLCAAAAVIMTFTGVAAAQPYGRDWEWGRGRGGYGWESGYGRADARGFEGARAVFFPHPTVRGLDVAAGRNGADTFCRHQGLGDAIHYDSSQRAPRAIGPEGQITGRSTVLRDLLCRKY